MFTCSPATDMRCDIYSIQQFVACMCICVLLFSITAIPFRFGTNWRGLQWVSPTVSPALGVRSVAANVSVTSCGGDWVSRSGPNLDGLCLLCNWTHQRHSHRSRRNCTKGLGRYHRYCSNKLILVSQKKEKAWPFISPQVLPPNPLSVVRAHCTPGQAPEAAGGTFIISFHDAAGLLTAGHPIHSKWSQFQSWDQINCGSIWLWPPWHNIQL